MSISEDIELTVREDSLVTALSSAQALRKELESIRDVVKSMPALPEQGGKGTKKASGKGVGNPYGMAAEEAMGIAKVAKEAMGVVQGIFEWVGQMAQTGVSLLQQGAELAINMSSQREATMGVLSKLLKSDKKAGEAYEKAVKLSQDLALDKTRTLDTLKKLLSTGFSNNQSDKIIEEMANLDKGRGEGQGKRLEMLVSRMQATGKTDQSTLRAAARQLGLSTNTIVGDLAKKLHESTAQVTAELKKGKIKSQDGIDEILSLVDKKFGGLAKKAGESIPGLVSAIKDQLTSMFDAVDLSPLKKLLAQVKDLLNGALGKEMKSAIGELFGSLFKALFGDIDAKGDKARTVINRIIGAIRTISDVIKVVVPTVKAFLGGLWEGLSQAFGGAEKPSKGGFLEDLKAKLPKIIADARAFGKSVGDFAVGFGKAITGVVAFAVKVSATMDSLQPSIDAIKPTLTAIGYAFLAVGAIAAVGIYLVAQPALFLIRAMGAIASVAPMVGSAIVNAFKTAVMAIGNFFIRIGSGAAEIGSKAVALGTAIVNGIVNGISAGLGAVVGAIKDMAGSAISAAKSVFGIASPSRVFSEMGQQNTAGLVGGTQKGSQKVTAAYNQMGAAAIGAAKGGSSGGSPSGGNGGGTTVNIYLDGKKEQSSKGGNDVEAAVMAGIRAYMQHQRVRG